MINNKLVSVANSNFLTSNPKAFKQNTKDVLKKEGTILLFSNISSMKYLIKTALFIVHFTKT